MDSSSLGALANLLKPPKEDGDSEDVCTVSAETMYVCTYVQPPFYAYRR